LTYTVKNKIAVTARRRFAATAARGLTLTMRRSDPEAVHPPPPRSSGEPRRVKVSELLAGEREAILEHGGQDYRLRITASGKLILTK
jgi:hemin uptake protein HemP